jgi:hypothetical protein
VIAYLDPVNVRLGETVYVMDADTVLKLGSHSPGGVNPEVALVLPYPPRSDTRSWPFACSLGDISTRLFPSPASPKHPLPCRWCGRPRGRRVALKAGSSGTSLSSRSCGSSACRRP